MAVIQNDKILILGGDERLAELAKLFKDKGYTVSSYGHERLQYKNIVEQETLEDGIANNNIIIGPIPFNSGDKLNMKLSDKNVSTEALLNLLKPGKRLFLGAPDAYFTSLARKENIEYSDYNKDEAFQIANAAITAEGTIAMIINERNTTINGSNILILGYGRIGKILSNYLGIFNPELYVAARKNADIAWINLKGYKGIALDKLEDVISNMDIIINTVPAFVFSNALIDRTSRDALIIDLASKPGGLDHSYAAGKKIRTIHALGLPGKIAPKSAAKVIFESIIFLH